MEKGGRWWWQGFGDEGRGQDLFALRVGGPDRDGESQGPRENGALVSLGVWWV
jgi:hypothetical protein